MTYKSIHGKREETGSTVNHRLTVSLSPYLQ
jgi:hypothetical protein